MPSRTTISGARRCADDEILDAHGLIERTKIRDDSLVAAAARRAIELGDGDALDRHSLRLGQADELGQTLVGARRHTNRGHAARAQCFENRIDAVDSHRSRSA